MDKILSDIAENQSLFVVLECEAIGSSCETDPYMHKPCVFTFSDVDSLMTYIQEFGGDELNKEHEECSADDSKTYKKEFKFDNSKAAFRVQSFFGNHRI